MTTPQAGNSFSLGNAVGFVDINTAGATSALNSLGSTIRNAFQSASSAFSNLGSQVTSFGTNLSIAMLPVAGAFNSGVSAAATFQDALAEIQARAGLTDEAMEQVRATALQLGADTAFSAQEAADAMLMLLTAGLDTEQALATLPAVLTGAAAAGADLGQTANQVTNIMSSFQLEAAEAARIVEVMNQAAGASPAEMAQMGEALAMVGGDARNFGLSLEQTGAILTVFARNGKVGAEAGTQLRSILTAMTADTDDSRRAWDMVNSSLFDANGNARDFGVVLAEIDAGLQNLSAEDQAFVIQSLAGSYGRVGLNALLASEGIESVIDEMGQQATAAEVAEARLDTFNGRMESLGGSIESLMITAFTPFIEFLTPIIESVIEVVNSITKWVEANQAIVQPILKVLSVLIVLGPTLIGVGQAFKLVGFLIGALTSPITLVLLAITAFTAAYVANFGGLRDKVQPVISALARQFRVIFSWFKDRGLLGGLRLFFTTFEDGSNAIGGLLRAFGVGERFAYGFGNAVNMLAHGIQNIIGWFGGLWSAISSGGMGGGLAFLYDTLIAPLLNIDWNSVGQTVLSGLGGIFSTIAGWLASAAGLIDWSAIPGVIIGGIGTAISAYGSWITFITDNLLTPMFNAAKTALGSVNWYELGSSIIGFIFGGFSGANTGGMNWGEIFTSFMTAIGNAALAVFDFTTWAVTNVITPLWTGIKDGLANVDWGEVATNIVGAIGTAFSTVVTWATWIYDNLLSPLVSNVASAVASVDWGAVGTSIMSALGTAFTTLIAWGTWIFDNILTPMVTFAGEAIASIDWYGVGSGIVNAIGTAITTVFDFIAWIINSIFNPVTENAESASGQIDWISVGYAILNGIGTALTTAFDFIMWLYNNILTPLVQGAADAIAQTDWSAVGQGLMDAIKNALPNIWQWVQDNIITPVSNALANFNPMDVIQGVGNIATDIGNSVGNFVSNFSIPGFDVGTNYVPNDMLALVHQGEAIVPKEYNVAAGGAGGVGMNFNGANFYFTANSDAEARSHARAFQSEMMELMRSS